MILTALCCCRLISFCRVGTGLSDEELDAVVTKLKPFFSYYLDKGVVYVVFSLITRIRKAMETKKTALYIKVSLRTYSVVLVLNQSIILSITSDIRTIRSEVFAAPYNLRYPRTDRVRYDKPWHECLDVQFKLMKWIKFEAAKLRGHIIHYSWLLDCHSHKKLLTLQPKYFLFLSDSSRKKLQLELDVNLDPYYSDLNIEDLKQHLSNISSSEDSKTITTTRGNSVQGINGPVFMVATFTSTLYLRLYSKVLDELAVRRMKLEISMWWQSQQESFSGYPFSCLISTWIQHGLQYNIERAVKKGLKALEYAPYPQKAYMLRILYSFLFLMSSRKVPSNWIFETFVQGAPFAHLYIFPVSLLSSEVNVIRERTLHVESQWLEDCFNKVQKLQEERYSLKPTSLEESRFGEW
ncbi:hypothetical protein RHSIM_Rhsim01G0115200 [Rhododendron simsii]|uniref:BRCT domain-containing protein n=1 Tax=Rhododendron simsii TaxID=118357 RepID=A0A834HR44_RHOSS|nr:hypothetical protein RHSIM_Rhsim01G0115200 [Rhododendron simsii]